MNNRKPLGGQAVNRFDPSVNYSRDDFKTVTTPKFYQEFSCIGGACENNCCHNWNITLDRPTYKQFKQHGDIKVRQVANKKTKSCGQNGIDYRQIKLEANGNCPFLEQDGLCYVHKNYGEQLLPPICNIYPREDRLIEGNLYNNISISCPEAARKILLDSSAMSFEHQQVNGKTVLPKFATRLNLIDAKLVEQFKQIAYNCILDENADTVEGRLYNLGFLFRMVSNRLKSGEPLGSLLDGFNELIVAGELDKTYQQTEPAERVQEFVLQRLLQEYGFNLNNEIFTEYRKQAYDKLKGSDAYQADTDSIILTDYYARHCQAGYERIVDTHGFSLINFMLHWVYSSQFDLVDGESLYSLFAMFTLKFFYIRTLCGILQHGDEQQNGQLLVGLIHSISRKADHDRVFLKQVYNALIEQGMAQPEHFLGLIKV